VCNRHAWAELRPFIADEVVVNGEPKSPDEYAEDLARLDDAFPDYRWRVQRTVFEAPWLAVQLRDSGTRRGPFHAAAGDGAVVTTDEFALYRIHGGSHPRGVGHRRQRAARPVNEPTGCRSRAAFARGPSHPPAMGLGGDQPALVQGSEVGGGRGAETRLHRTRRDGRGCRCDIVRLRWA